MAWTASTTTMASSTTMAMASTNANSVKRLSENPANFKKKNVPTNDTITAMAGIKVERKSCKKTYTTINTSINASMIVSITLSMDAKRKSVVSITGAHFIP